MTTTEQLPLRLLFEQDETAWLEIMSLLAAEGRYAEMDFANLSEYLADMSKGDRREVSSGYALSVLADANADARKQAAAETGLSRGTFPIACVWDLESLLADDDKDAETGAAPA